MSHTRRMSLCQKVIKSFKCEFNDGFAENLKLVQKTNFLSTFENNLNKITSPIYKLNFALKKLKEIKKNISEKGPH